MDLLKTRLSADDHDLAALASCLVEWVLRIRENDQAIMNLTIGNFFSDFYKIRFNKLIPRQNFQFLEGLLVRNFNN